MCRHCLPEVPRCRRYAMGVQVRVPLRCMGFDPLHGAADQRSGDERWPTMKQDVEECRRLEAEYAASQAKRK